MGSRQLMRQPIQWDLIAVVFTRVLLRCGIAPLADTLEQVQPCSLQAFQKIRASVGQQARSSRIPPLVRTNNVSKFKDPSPVCQSFQFCKERKMMFCWYKNPSNGCTKGPDSLLLNTFPLRRRGDQTSRKLESHAMPQMF